MKKIISAVMAVATVASMASLTAFASNGNATTLDSTGAKELFASNVNVQNLLDGDGVKAFDNSNKIQSDSTFYIQIANDIIGNSIQGSMMDNEGNWKLKVKKNDGSKQIKAITLLDKDITKGRHAYIKVELNEDFTDKEYKVDLDLTLTNKSKKNVDLPQGVLNSTGSIKSNVTFWVSNNALTGDQDQGAGTSGVVYKPTKDDDNTYTWQGRSGDDVARLKFVGDSDVNKFYTKLSTVWDNEDYRSYFNDQDAFFFDFVANPTLSSTSRATLEIYNPFVDEDGNSVVEDPTDIMIYQIVDGELVDATASFTFGENEDGDEVYTTKTRTLGTYIFAEKEANYTDDTTVEEPTIDEPTVVEPKPTPSTGRF